MTLLNYVTGSIYPLNAEKQLNKLKNQSPFVLLETSRVIGKERTSYLFTDPVDILTVNRPSDLSNFNYLTQKAINQGLYLAGWWSYEFGYLLEPKLHNLLAGRHPNIPLVWLGVFKKPQVWQHNDSDNVSYPGPTPDCSNDIKEIKTSVDLKKYVNAISSIKNYISEGHTYQVNYTFKTLFKFYGDPVELYLSLRSQQAVSYSAIIRAGDTWVLSLSPELFFRIDGNTIESRPMKGTIKRGKTPEEDSNLADFLHNDPKNRAENVMIVDLLRNDIGRLCEYGDVRVPQLFLVERYKSLFQMTSQINGKLSPTLDINQIISGLFPCGSVTGAPKIRTMEIIAELEDTPRGIYTGSVGFIGPGQAALNVSIRTVVLNTRNRTGELGIGSGITIDSDPMSEYEECILKGLFLQKKQPQFSLIETMALYPDSTSSAQDQGICKWPLPEITDNNTGILLLSLHLQRIKKSAHFFDIPLNQKDLIQEIEDFLANRRHDSPAIIRILVNQAGEIRIEKRALPPVQCPVSITISPLRVDSTNTFLYHKTTSRDMFNTELNRIRNNGFFDVIFMNERGEITEGAISNLFVKKSGRLLTPPIKSGLLNGCLRQMLIQKGIVKEQVLYQKDIELAEEIYIGNSVRGPLRAVLK